MGTKCKVYCYIGGALVLIVSAMQMRSAIASAKAYSAEAQVAWAEDLRTDQEASQLVDQSGGSYYLALGDKQGEIVYFGLPQTSPTSTLSNNAREIVEDMQPTSVIVSQHFVLDPSIVASCDDIEVHRIEMTLEDERVVLVGRYGTRVASLYLAVREYWKAIEREQIVPSEADSFLMSTKSSLGLSWPGETVADFDELWQFHYPSIGDWRYGSSRLLDPGHDYGVLSEVAEFAVHAYDVHSVLVITELVVKGERVVAFSDPIMVARLEKVLRASLGLPATIPTIEESQDGRLRDKASHTQPAMKQAPPSGVTAPNQSTRVRDIK